MKKENKIIIPLFTVSLIILIIIFGYHYYQHDREKENDIDEEEDDEDEEINGGIQIMAIEGAVNNGSIDRLHIYIEIWGDVKVIAMNEVLIHIIVIPKGGTARSEDLSYNHVTPGVAVAGSNYGTKAVVDPLGTFPDLLDQESILKMEIILGGLSPLPTLPPDSEVEIKIMQAVGGIPANEEFDTPEEYPADGKIVVLVD